MFDISKRILLSVAVMLLAACATPVANYDYTEYRQSKPSSIVVLPPLNNSPDMHATYSVLSAVTGPLAEAGYYVFPVALVDQTFKENGLNNPGEMHQAPLNKIREIFGADAALYLTVTQYGSSYKVISSDITVALEAKLVDTRNGKLLWEGTALATDANNYNNSGGLIGLLVAAVVKQIANNVGSDSTSHNVAIIATASLLFPRQNGLLYGPRSSHYGK